MSYNIYTPDRNSNQTGYEWDYFYENLNNCMNVINNSNSSSNNNSTNHR